MKILKQVIGWISFLWFIAVAFWKWFFVTDDYRELDGDISDEGIQAAQKFATGYKPTDE